MTVNSDIFTDTNGTALQTHDANWSIIVGGFEIQNNQCAPTQDVNGLAAYSGSYGNDQYSQGKRPVIAAASAKRAGFAVRVQTGPSAYFFQLRDGGTPRRSLYKIVSGTLTSLASDNLAISTTAVYKIEAIGNAIKTYVDDVELFSVTDSSIPTGGSPGLHGRDASGTDHRIDDWEGGDVGGSPSGNPWYYYAQQ